MNTQRVEGHSPLPWVKDKDGQLNGANGESVNTWGLGMGFAPRSVLTEANANYVLYAVNNIERLEKVNEALVRALEAFVEWDEQYPKGVERSYGVVAIVERELDALCESARKTMALAKEPA